MIESAVYRPHPEEPARARLNEVQESSQPGHAWAGLRARRFEVVSRGDFVPGMLYLPREMGPTPAPLLLLQHGTGGSTDSPELTCAARWVRDGLAVAMIDLPLHGARSSPKLSERLVTGIQSLARGADLDLDTGALVEEFARQSTSDLIRTLDAICALPEIDADRVGFMGMSLGAIVGSYLLAHDRRLRAAVFALAGGGYGPEALDPSTYLALAAKVRAGEPNKTALLFVAAEDDSVVSSAATQTLFDVAGEPKWLARFPGTHDALPGEAFGEIWRFLAKALGV